jgi:hypothetical protein
VDFILTTEAIKEGFQNLNHPQTMIIYTTPDFPELLATGYWVWTPGQNMADKQVLSIEGANPNIGNGRGPI